MRPTAPPASRILAHEIADQVRDLIDRGVYEPGSPLRQEEIAARLKVSRIPVREAFRLLEADGVVMVLPNRGAFVSKPGTEEVAELFDVRLLLEKDLLRRAVANLSEPVLRELEWLNDRIASSQSAAEWVRFDEEFHLAIYAAAGRKRTLALVTVLRRSLNSYYLRYLRPGSRAAAWRSEHQALVRALRRRDADRAVAALERHLAATRDALVAALRRSERVGTRDSRRK